jgi:hypothetical protein
MLGQHLVYQRAHWRGHIGPVLVHPRGRIFGVLKQRRQVII